MKQGRERKQIRKPSEVFKCCPACESPNLLHFESEVLCLYCDWNSIEINVEARLSAQCQAYRDDKLGQIDPLPLNSGTKIGAA